MAYPNLAILKNYRLLFLITILFNYSCNSNKSDDTSDRDEFPISFYYGADLSYVNEMEDCGATYKNSNGTLQDPYAIFKNEGANLVRLRLWHNPTWTNYSNLQDVKQSIQRAKNQGMHVLLDFHYSDTWTDPSQQQIPAAWLNSVDNTEALGNLLYNYTYNTLLELFNENLLPNIVQVGNEINPMILQDGDLVLGTKFTFNK